MHLKGTLTALITPFMDQQLDELGLIHNIHFQLEQGIQGLLLLGSTGEASTLTREEQDRVISIGVKEARGKVPILVGTGSNSTQTTIDNTLRAKKLGADGALVVTPYYNKPTQEGIFRHFEAICKQVNFPLIVYNHPGRAGVRIDIETMMRIANLPNIAGIKETSDNMSYINHLFYALKDETPSISILSGDDIWTYPMMALGAQGVISVASNLVPAKVKALTDHALQSNYEKAKEMHFELLGLYQALFLETNPIPIKTAMQLCNKAAGPCRLPLCEMSDKNYELLNKVLIRMNLKTLNEP